MNISPTECVEWAKYVCLHKKEYILRMAAIFGKIKIVVNLFQNLFFTDLKIQIFIFQRITIQFLRIYMGIICNCHLLMNNKVTEFTSMILEITKNFVFIKIKKEVL